MSNSRGLRKAIGSRRGWSTSAALLGAGGLVVWTVGAADAATGGKFLLGKSNHESHTATLVNSTGIPLSLKAKSGAPPLKVNSSKLVPKLNANFVGGLPASKLQRRVTGSCVTGIGSIPASGAVSCAKPTQLVFTADGTVTIPKGVTEITGEIWGGGGGGGTAFHATTYYAAQPGGAGGDGAFERVLIDVDPGEVLHVVVGGAGAAGKFADPTQGNNYTDGGSGGTSALKTAAGAVLAGAGGGHGGVSLNCSADAAGGDPEALGSRVVGLESHSGAPGHCDDAKGHAGFAGGGGGAASGYYYLAPDKLYGAGYDGEPGLVIITFAG